MKKITFLFALLLGTSVGLVQAQTFVGTDSTKRAVLFEEYTGTGCQFCPNGHRAGADNLAKYPNQFFAINIHQGGYADQFLPNFKTQWGNALASQLSISGYPSATLNRTKVAGDTISFNPVYLIPNTGIEKPYFIKNILDQNSCVNVAAKSTIDWEKRELKVTVEAYYTGDSKTETNMLNVALLQNNIKSVQIDGVNYGGGAFLVPDYTHNHMLRDLITGQWGDTIQNTTQNSFFTKTYTYTIPQTINNVPINPSNDLEVIVFVAEGKKEVITASRSEIEYLNQNSVFISNIQQDTVISCDPNASLNAVVYYTNTSSTTISSMKIGYKYGNHAEEIITIPDINIEGFASSSYKISGLLPALGQKEELIVRIVEVNDEEIPATVLQSRKSFNLFRDTIAQAKAPLTLILNMDALSFANNWTFSSSTAILASKSGYAGLSPTPIVKTVRARIVPPTTGCYKFTITDFLGDGINSAAYGLGSYSIVDTTGRIIASSDGKFGLYESKSFNVTDILSVNSTMPTAIGKVAVYPNPVRDNVTVDMDLTEATGIEVQVCDLLGKVLESRPKANYAQGHQTIEMNLQHLPNGVYMLKLQTNAGVTTQKIVINR